MFIDLKKPLLHNRILNKRLIYSKYAHEDLRTYAPCQGRAMTANERRCAPASESAFWQYFLHRKHLTSITHYTTVAHIHKRRNASRLMPNYPLRSVTGQAVSPLAAVAGFPATPAPSHYTDQPQCINGANISCHILPSFSTHSSLHSTASLHISQCSSFFSTVSCFLAERHQ